MLAFTLDTQSSLVVGRRLLSPQKRKYVAWGAILNFQLCRLSNRH